MRLYRVDVYMDLEVEAFDPAEAATKARDLFFEKLRKMEVRVSEDDGSCWEEVGRFAPTETQR